MRAAILLLFLGSTWTILAQAKVDTIITNNEDTIIQAADHFLNQYLEKRQEAIANFEGFPAANFEATDLDANNHRLSYYQGQVVLLVFGSSFCDPCLRQIPSLMRLTDELDSLSFQVLYFVNDTPEVMNTYMERYMKDITINFPIIPNSTTFARVYGGAIGFPRVFIVDKYGLIHKVFTDSDDYDEWFTYKKLKPMILDLLKL